MTERRSGSLSRDADSLAIGRSELWWNGRALTIQLDEITAPWPSRVRGRITLHPQALAHHVELLAADGRHCWQPIAPCARVEVKLDAPAASWNGMAYLDSNSGDSPIEDAFTGWHWSRSSLRDGSAVLYDCTRRSGERDVLALHFDTQGRTTRFEPPASVALPGTGWRIRRETRADDLLATVAETLEDTPFYARSVIESKLRGERAIGVHESLDLDRFRQPIVQAMLPFRMPRARR